MFFHLVVAAKMSRKATWNEFLQGQPSTVSNFRAGYFGHVLASSFANLFRPFFVFQEPVWSVASRACLKFQEPVRRVASWACLKFQERVRRNKEARDKNVITPPHPPTNPLFWFWLESYVDTAWVLSTFICALQGSRERYRVTLWTPPRLAIRCE